MNRVNLTTDQVARAAIHEALGEPVRLAIAELLVRGDAAPKDLAQAFDLPTNLLAHHLSVMERAGLIGRRRSEGDGRRTYVRLNLDVPTVGGLVGLTGPDPLQVSRIVFVCTHNSARSQLAAAEWQRVSRVPAASAGTRPAARVHRRAIAVGRRHNLALSGRATAHIEDIVASDDLVIAVCDRAHEEMTGSSRSGGSLHWSIPDPVRIDSDQAFEQAFSEISARVHRLATSMDDSR
jgi:protein-tyrosine-phosphatase